RPARPGGTGGRRGGGRGGRWAGGGAASAGPGRALQELELLGDETPEVVALEDSRAGPLAERPREAGIREHPRQVLCEGRAVAELEEQARHAVLDDGAVAADVRGDARDAGAHRLEQDLRVSLAQGGQHEGVGLGEMAGNEAMLDDRNELGDDPEAPRVPF